MVGFRGFEISGELLFLIMMMMLVCEFEYSISERDFNRIAATVVNGLYYFSRIKVFKVGFRFLHV